MSRILIFASVALSILFGLHYYVWTRLVRDTGLPSPWRAIATAAIVLLGASLPAVFILGRTLSRDALKPLAWPAYVWLGLLMFLFLLLVTGDAARLMMALIERARGGERIADPERRVAMARLFGGAVAAMAVGLGALATRTGIARAIVRDVEVTLGRLPRALDGLVIVQLTDVHVGPTIGRDFIENLVAKSNAAAPDLVCITGDLVDGSVERLREQVAPLAQLKAKHGVFFVTGNHEYYSGVDEWIAELGRLGVRVLRNQRVTIGDGAAALDLAGVDDHSSTGLAPGHGPDLARALDGRDASRECILLAHQPRAIHEAARLGVGLQLSGHTHGGQIWPWNYLVRLQQPYIVGFAREGETQLYVSPGTGYWGPPMRLGTRGEITRIVLRAARPS